MNCDTCGVMLEPEAIQAAIQADCIAATCGVCWAVKEQKRERESALLFRVFSVVNEMRGLFLTDAECARIVAVVDAERRRG